MNLKTSVYHCPECRGTRIQGQCWYSMNTGETHDHANEVYYCEDCEKEFDHVVLSKPAFAQPDAAALEAS